MSEEALHLLSNGRYSALLSPRGGGYAALDGFALTRWSPDPVTDAQGWLIYVRDVESGEFWTIGGGTAASAATASEFDGRVARFAGTRSGIACVLEVCVDADHDAEVRRLQLTSAGDAPRHLEVTTYAELALNTPAGDAAHPAFSKLFVQTSFEPDRNALLAWRRQRSPEDRPLWVAHTLLHDCAVSDVSFETNRMRFIGRGRDSTDPAAMYGELSGNAGNVLDPVFSMRAVVRIAPGETVTFAAILAAAGSRDVVLRTVASFTHVAAAAAAMERAVAAGRDDAAVLGLPSRWRETLQIAMGAASYTLEPADRLPALRVPDGARDTAEPLQFFNGYGGFSADGDEYVIRMPVENGQLRRTPLPWVNVIANEDAGCIVSESGAIYTWAGNSRENRLTPWTNDPVSDPHREAIYIRDEADDAVWSPLPGPRPGTGAYEVRHGFGRTRVLHDSHDIACETAVFVPSDAPVRTVRVQLTNNGAASRRLTIFSYAQLVLGGHEAETRGNVDTWEDGGVLYARNPQRGEFSARVALACAAAPDGISSWTTDRAAFLGRGGSTSNPAALRGRALDGRAGAGLDPCFAIACDVEIPPGATVAVAFTLGEAPDENAARRIAGRFSDLSNVDAALDVAVSAWHERLGSVRISTPSRALDLMVNGWLAYQNLSCRMWARSAYYQSGGAFGFRDQLQDSSALLYLDPAFTRAQILLHAAHQFVEGDVLHWWHPPRSKGIRTRFSDDLLWLPYITLFYLHSTGDHAVLDEDVRFLRARLLEAGEDETFLVPEDAGTSADLYEHCCLALDRSLTRGAHGLPLMGVGDWNDGMNRVGREGRGESVWLGFFLYDILGGFISVCERRGDHDRVTTYTKYRELLGRTLNDTGWDGEWYRRAYYDNGDPLGSAQSDECRIDALAQAWAVMSGAAPPDRAASALDSMEERLVCERDGLIRLLTPAFDRTPNDPGYIKGYIPGVRENGGQYTHGVLWAIRALAEAGRSERAARLLEMLTPVIRGSEENVQRYMVEPYVVAADVYGVEPHIGRGGWTWYTGSAGWMFRIALESILGFTLHEGREIRLEPCIPDDWDGFAVRYRAPEGTVFIIDVQRADADESRVVMDGTPVGVADGVIAIPLLRDGAEHRVIVHLGAQSAAAPLERITSA